MLDLGTSHPNYIPSSLLSKRIKDFHQQTPTLIPFLKKETQFYEINAEQTFDNAFKDLCKTIEPTVIHVRSGGSSNELRKEIVQKLSAEHGFVNLEVNSLIRDENERKTDIGLEFLSMVSAGKIIPAEMIVRMLRKVIYSGLEGQDKFILSSFPDIIEQAKEFEKNCAAITAIIYATNDDPVIEIKNNNLTLFNIDALFQKEFRLKTMANWDFRQFNELLGQKTDYNLVIGRGLSGKTAVCGMLAKMGQKLIDYKAVEEVVKKNLSTEEEPVEEAPIPEVFKEALKIICEDKKAGNKCTYIFDGTYGKTNEEFVEFLDNIGPPTNILRCLTEDGIIRQRFKTKNETEEIGEEQDEAFKAEEAAQRDTNAFFEQHYAQFGNRVVQTDLNTEFSEETTFGELKKQFACQVVLINHEKRLTVDTTAANLAIKYNLIYISVYQLIKQQIENKTELGKKLQATQKFKDIKLLQSQQKDDFNELEFSAVHFDLDLVIQLIKETLAQVRTNQKYVIIEGLCNSSKLVKEDDKLELRYMDELFMLEKHIGEVCAIIGLQFNYEKELIEEHEIQYEAFPEEPVVEEKPKVEGEEGEEAEEQPPAEEEEKKGKPLELNLIRTCLQS